jgi:hypothetical protein
VARSKYYGKVNITALKNKRAPIVVFLSPLPKQGAKITHDNDYRG